jgi:hypothetical protein
MGRQGLKVMKLIEVLGFEVLRAVGIFWAIIPCSTLKVNHVSEEYVASFFMVE